MAYQTRSRSPLFDSDTQEILEKRGRELIGLALLAAETCGMAGAVKMHSKSPAGGVHDVLEPVFVENIIQDHGAAPGGGQTG